jgi:tRNA G18 (ribose-2'-O)-methylase SpoU
MREIVLIAHNLRSCQNVGSLLRTSDGLGIRKVYLTGYTPYPVSENDERLPHMAKKIDARIQKTSLGSENSVDWEHREQIIDVIEELKPMGYIIAALEQTAHSLPLPDYKPPEKIAIVVGREVEGIEPEVLDLCDLSLEIPMLGQKESYNVSVAAAIALYHCRFTA